MDSKNKLISQAALLFIVGPGSALLYLPYLIIKLFGLGFSAPNYFSYLAIIFWLFGLYLMYKSVTAFIFIGQGTPAPFAPPQNFVSIDIYKFNRNPMYTGALLFLLGNLIWTQVIWFFFYLCFFVLLFHLYVVWREEPKLKKKFGPSYEEYLAKVPRWLPGFKK